MPVARLHRLTDADVNLAVHVAGGCTARDIARAPSPYRRTEDARKAVEALLREAGARTRAQLAGWMAATGLVTAPERDTEELRAAPTLFPRLQKILQGLADGLTVPEITERLGVSKTSMDGYIGTLYAQLRVRTLEQAVVAGVLTELVTPARPGAPERTVSEAAQ
ncbi:LuxR C-terminal-related transcriptional regulator [Kitasatospora sp. NPDC051984]|uniref:helix-turn-helix transcriptional regulator n=1 Tax=Kitasatospora sp. NPDC051984 TaxID=3364059 RepID=UPI0037C9E478